MPSEKKIVALFKDGSLLGEVRIQCCTIIITSNDIDSYLFDHSPHTMNLRLLLQYHLQFSVIRYPAELLVHEGTEFTEVRPLFWILTPASTRHSKTGEEFHHKIELLRYAVPYTRSIIMLGQLPVKVIEYQHATTWFPTLWLVKKHSQFRGAGSVLWRI